MLNRLFGRISSRNRQPLCSAAIFFTPTSLNVSFIMNSTRVVFPAFIRISSIPTLLSIGNFKLFKRCTCGCIIFVSSISLLFILKQYYSKTNIVIYNRLSSLIYKVIRTILCIELIIKNYF